MISLPLPHPNNSGLCRLMSGWQMRVIYFLLSPFICFGCVFQAVQCYPAVWLIPSKSTNWLVWSATTRRGRNLNKDTSKTRNQIKLPTVILKIHVTPSLFWGMAKNVKTFRLISHLQFGADCVVFGVCWRETCLTSFAQEITSFFSPGGMNLKFPFAPSLKQLQTVMTGRCGPNTHQTWWQVGNWVLLFQIRLKSSLNLEISKSKREG